MGVGEGLDSESDTRHETETWRGMGSEECGGYPWKGGCFSPVLPFLSDCNLDDTPNQLTPQDPQLCLIDAGCFMNSSCPSLFRSGRQVDLILSFNYNQSFPFKVPSHPVGTTVPSQAYLHGWATGPCLTLPVTKGGSCNPLCISGSSIGKSSDGA